MGNVLTTFWEEVGIMLILSPYNSHKIPTSSLSTTGYPAPNIYIPCRGPSWTGTLTFHRHHSAWGWLFMSAFPLPSSYFAEMSSTQSIRLSRNLFHVCAVCRLTKRSEVFIMMLCCQGVQKCNQS